ncbi:thioredoxin family protein [Halobaculum sp. MBLA0147]|uniref:thioredoxin family protein n=1 Tax=Halobaculum sp. MBLA0147 TaxID=3079934 RepID=UPI00352527CD
MAETDLETLRPAPDWDAAAHADAVETLGTAELTYHVWTADWCPDCREQVPAFAAALDAAGVDPSAVHVYPVERDDDGKYGPGMETFDVSLIPTVVVERDGEELARFEESAPRPLVVALAAALADATE